MASSKPSTSQDNGTDIDILLEAPKEISVLEYAEARALEMEAMARAASVTFSNKLVNQMLPRHMRRRAAGHNVKRLPRRLHDAANREFEKNKPTKNKRPSRRHRRRPSNLLQAYNRRQRTHVWLETHIWHAKRFHMTEEWGYKIPLSPNDKGVRAAYRAAAHHCLLHDLSYMCCIEVRGPVDCIVQGLQRLSSPELGPTIGAAMYMKGTREGATVLYKHDQYPQAAIGQVRFLWKPTIASQEEQTSVVGPSETPSRQLWIWVHPACYNEVLQELTFALEVTLSPTEVKDTVKVTSTKKADGKKSKKSSAKTTKGKSEDPVKIPNPVYSNGTVSVTSLKDSLCRFRLTGPASVGVLLDALYLADIGSSDGQQGAAHWWETLYGSPACREAHDQQGALWQMMKGVRSPGELSPHSVLGLTVRDPRVFLPRKRTKVDNDADGEAILDPAIQRPWHDAVSWSPIWQESVRQEVTSTRLSEQEFNRRRSQLLVPGSELQLGREESRIPVLLIQNPGVQSQAGRGIQAKHKPNIVGFGSGWDLILPVGWAMAFWVSLVYRGARAVGLQELCSNSQEQGALLYPDDYPDTPACQVMEESTRQHLQAKYDRMPPAKRPNHVKFGVAAPFRCPWKSLVEDWVSRGGLQDASSTQLASGGDTNQEEIDFIVLRERRSLQAIANATAESETSTSKHGCKVESEPKPKVARTSVTHTSVHAEGSLAAVTAILTAQPRCLVPVHITCIRRGAPEAFSMICLPNASDVQALAADLEYGGPLEPLHRDNRQTSKKQGSSSTKKEDISKGEVSRAEKKSDNADCDTSQDTCSRTVIGYIKHGSFSFTSARGCGMGFVALGGLVYLLQARPRGSATFVLVRSPASLQYRCAYISVVQ